MYLQFVTLNGGDARLDKSIAIQHNGKVTKGTFLMPYSDVSKNTPKSGKTAPHHATDENLELLEGMAMNGATKEQMADALGICKDTLNKYYGDYLKSVKPLFDARVARQLKKNIFHEDPKIALDATKFYLNSKVGYKQSSENSHTMEGLPNFTVNFSSETPSDA